MGVVVRNFYKGVNKFSASSDLEDENISNFEFSYDVNNEDKGNKGDGDKGEDRGGVSDKKEKKDRYLKNPAALVGSGYLGDENFVNPLYEIKVLLNNNIVNIEDRAKPYDIFIKMSRKIAIDFDKNMRKFAQKIFGKSEIKKFVKKLIKDGFLSDRVVRQLVQDIFSDDSPYRYEIDTLLDEYYREFENYKVYIDNLIKSISALVSKYSKFKKNQDITQLDKYRLLLALREYLSNKGLSILNMTFAEIYSRKVVYAYFYNNIEKLDSVLGIVSGGNKMRLF